MFSGLNNLIKFILPKRLFYRALIIVAAPTIILQIIITVVFYDSIWIKANKNITRSLVSQLKTIQNAYMNNRENLLKGGKSGKGPAKLRGNASYYRDMQRKSVQARMEKAKK